MAALAVAAVTSMSESRHAPLAEGLGLGDVLAATLAEGLGLGDGLADPLAEGAAEGSASSVGSPSGEGDIVRPKLGDGLAASAEGSSPDPKAAWSSHHPSHRTTSSPTMTAARRRQ
jgi:hypothetical protein